jgi:hypothetical protein
MSYIHSKKKLPVKLFFKKKYINSTTNNNAKKINGKHEKKLMDSIPKNRQAQTQKKLRSQKLRKQTKNTTNQNLSHTPLKKTTTMKSKTIETSNGEGHRNLPPPRRSSELKKITTSHYTIITSYWSTDYYSL